MNLSNIIPVLFRLHAPPLATQHNVVPQEYLHDKDKDSLQVDFQCSDLIRSD